MTNEELLALIEETPPEDWSVEQIELLRARMAESLELRSALGERLQLENYLAATVGSTNVSTAKIVAAAARIRARAAPPRRRMWPWSIALAISMAAAAILTWHQLYPPPRPGSIARGTSANEDGRDSGPSATTDSNRDRRLEPPPHIPAPVAPEPDLPPRLVTEAESFVRGNVTISKTDWGQGIGVIASERPQPSFVEFEIDAPEAGPYKLETRYAAEQPRPFQVTVNGQLVAPRAGDETTGAWLPDAQRWFDVGTATLAKGKNHIRLDAPGQFPALDKVAISLSDGVPALLPAFDVPFRLEMDAESHDTERSNVVVGWRERDREFGRRRGRWFDDRTVYGPLRQRYFVEYSIEVPKAASYRVLLRYSAAEPRPLITSLNGRVVNAASATEATGSWETASQRWVDVGVFPFLKGFNVLRFEASDAWNTWSRPSYFPRMAKLAIEDPRLSAPAIASERMPWDEERQLAAAPRPYESLTFEDISKGDFTPTSADLRRWFTGVSGHPLNISDRDLENRRCGLIDGRALLRAPWPPDGLLRLATFDANKFRLHFWRGDRGVMLHYHQDRRFAWAAYVTLRQAGAVEPATFALAATDDDRSYRTSMDGNAQVDIYWRDGELVVSRGGIRLLAAPLDGPPEQVVVEGRVGFRGLALTHVSDLPAAPEVSKSPVVANDRQKADEKASLNQVAPAKRDWETRIDKGAKFDRADDGSVELAAKNANEISLVTTLVASDVGEATLREVTCVIESPTPGASVVLATATDNPVEMLRFVRDKRTGKLVLWFVGWGDARVEGEERLDNGPAPFVGDRVYLKFVSRGELCRAWMSVDGRHWAHPWDVRTNWNGLARRIGLALWPGKEPRQIRMTALDSRPLAALAKFAPAALRQRVLEVIPATKSGAWRERVAESRPREIPLAAWRCAAAYEVLVGKAAGTVAQLIVDDFAEGIVDSEGTHADKQAALFELAMIANTWDDASRAQGLMRAFVRAGEVETRRVAADQAAIGDTPVPVGFRPYRQSAAAMIASPIACRHGAFPPLGGLARLELLQLVGEQAWSEVDQLCLTLKFRDERPTYSRQEPTIVDWAHALARRNLPAAAGQGALPMQAAWYGPLVDQINTEAFNVLSEFSAAVEGDSLADAAQIIASAGGKLVGATETLGVLPDAKDPNLLVSLRVAIALAMRDHPGLAAAMNQHFGPTARLRVQKAIVEGNVAGLEAATLQFHGTDAAAEAHLWLGNRALAAGEFARALGHFRHAAEQSPGASVDDAAARGRLTAALLGRDGGSAAAATIRLGDMQVAASEFEQIVGEMRRRSDDTADRSALNEVDQSPSARAPPPDRLTAFRWGEVALGGGAAPRSFDENALGERADWFARTTSLAVAGSTLIANGRSSAAAFDTTTGQERWKAALDGDRGDAADWPPAQQRPLVVGGRVLIRWVSRSGPRLVCLDLENGRNRWQSQMPGEEFVAGDPFWAQDELFAIVARRIESQQQYALSLASIDVESGAVLRSRPLVRVRSSWRDLAVCETTLVGDTAITSLGGCVVCCDLSGQVHWARVRQTIPPRIDAWSWIQMAGRPLVSGDKVIVAAPSVRDVTCLDVHTGRAIWRRFTPNLAQLVAVCGEVLVVQDADGLSGLGIADGKQLWRYDVDGSIAPLMTGAPERLLAVEYAYLRNGSSANVPPWKLVWLDPKSGRRLGEWNNPDWKSLKGRFAPAAVVSTGRIWGLYAVDGRSPARELFELLPPGVKVSRPAPPKTEPPPTEPKDAPPNAQTPVAKEIAQAAAKTLPGWQVASAAADGAGTLVQHLESADTVLAVASKHPVRFTRKVTIAAGKSGKLRIKAGYVANETWQIRVMAGDRELLETKLGGKAQPGWERYELDLTPLAGKEFVLEVVATSPDGTERKTLWKRLEVQQ